MFVCQFRHVIEAAYIHYGGFFYFTIINAMTCNTINNALKVLCCQHEFKHINILLLTFVDD